MSPQLVRPSAAFRASFVEALNEGYKLTNTDAHIPEPAEKIAAIAADFDGFVRDMLNPSPDWALPNGMVIRRPDQTIYWYVDGEIFLGSGTLRFDLPPELVPWAGNVGYTVRPSLRGQGHATTILKLLMQRAREDRGLDEIQVCADEDNFPSLRVIEKLGGLFDGLAPHLLQPGTNVRRYRLPLS